MSNFQEEMQQRLRDTNSNQRLRADANAFTQSSIAARYSYNFSWQGRPIIQYPQDIVAMQELIWTTRPDLIIETGIAHGGSLILSASLLTMLDYADAITSGELLDPRAPRRRVLGVDIDIRAHNREAILAHPLAGRIDLLEGSSVDPAIVAKITTIARRYQRVMVCLDSNHTHDHVLAELEAYAPLTSQGSYCVVFDTVIEDLSDTAFPDRPWGKGDNPKTAVIEYLRRLSQEGRTAADGSPLTLEIDRTIDSKLLVTAAPSGYLRRTSQPVVQE